MEETKELITTDDIRSKVYIIRGQQVMLDKEYIKSQSIWKDLLILLKTIPAVLTGRGAY